MAQSDSGPGALFVIPFLYVVWINILYAFMPYPYAYYRFYPYAKYNYEPKHISAAVLVWLGTTILTASWMYCRRRRSTGFLIVAAGLTAIFAVISL